MFYIDRIQVFKVGNFYTIIVCQIYNINYKLNYICNVKFFSNSIFNVVLCFVSFVYKILLYNGYISYYFFIVFKFVEMSVGY